MKKNFLFLFAILISFYATAQVPNINLVLVVPTGFSSPIDLKNCGDERIFVVEQAGRIKIMDKSGNIRATPFLDITSRVETGGNEQGLLSLAFSPNYKQDGFFYVNYIFDNGTTGGETRISRFSVNPADSNLALSNSEVIVLTFAQPTSENNHKGATLMFGPDGYLYDSQGDGGGGGDLHGTFGNGQNKNTYLGKMLRLDVTGQATYVVPPTNPFVGVAGTKPEIWSYGLRNPWRCAFDRITGDMWIADVGQQVWEEVDFQPASSAGGENYGWRCYEGNVAYNTSGCASASTMTFPVYAYNHAASFGSSCSVTGGYVYRGAQYSALWGRYLYTDYCSGRFLSIKQTSPGVFDPDTLQDFSNNAFTSFGEDNNGELYVCYRGSGTGGRIYRLTETTNCNPFAFISLNDTIEACNPVTISALRGDTLAYQWYDVNGIINGATAYQYTVPQSGWYKVKVSKTLHAGCEAMSDSVYVNAQDTTALVEHGTLTYCLNEAQEDLSNHITPNGGIFSGTGVSGSNFTPATAGVGVKSLAYDYTNSFGCASKLTFQVTVNDTTALVKNNLDSVFCITDPDFSLTGFYNVTGGIFSGNGVANDDSTFSPASAGAGVVPIRYSYSNLSGCSSSASFNLAVGLVTTLSTTITDSTYCNYEAAFPLTGFVSHTGGVFNGNGISGNNFDPSAAQLGSNTISYLYTNTYGCVSLLSFDLEVADITPLTAVFPAVDYCNNASPFTLDGFVLPAGGIYSGSGVTNNTFSPAAAGVGPATIYYDYTNNSGCVSRDTFGWNVINCTGINELSENLSFSIFPNPNKGSFNLEVKVNSIQQAEMFVTDALGKICYHKNQLLDPDKPNISVELPQLAKGVYAVLLKGKEGNAMKSLVIE